MIAVAGASHLHFAFAVSGARLVTRAGDAAREVSSCSLQTSP